MALPVYFMMGLAIFAFFIYPSINLLLTPSLHNLNTVSDSFTTYLCSENKCNMLDHSGKGEINIYSIPPASDIPISQICQILYFDYSQ